METAEEGSEVADGSSISGDGGFGIEKMLRRFSMMEQVVRFKATNKVQDPG